MLRWTLVHNDFGDLPTEAHELIIAFRNHRRGLPIEIWGPEALIREIPHIPKENLSILFPQGLSADDLRRINYRDIDDLVRSMGDLLEEPLDAEPVIPSSQKLKRNGFSPEVVGILTAGFLSQHKFTSYFGDTSRSAVGNRLAEKFKKLYVQEKETADDADQIFFSLADAVGGLSCAKSRRAAIVGLIAYMFHSCEIFEDAEAVA